MDQPRTCRAPGTPVRHGRLLSILAAGALTAGLAGCGGLTLPGGAPTGPVFQGDPCSLLTTAELEAAIGSGNVSGSPEPTHESTSSAGCAWTLTAPGDPVGDSVNLTIVSAGGAADFAATRQFLEALEGSPEPGTPADDSPDPSVEPSTDPSASPSELASPDPSDNLGIALQSVPGLGDDAFIGAAGTVYTIKGDIELELQLIAFDDPEVQQHTIDLLKKAIARLP